MIEIWIKENNYEFPPPKPPPPPPRGPPNPPKAEEDVKRKLISKNSRIQRNT
jgi:hypothetical protein